MMERFPNVHFSQCFFHTRIPFVKQLLFRLVVRHLTHLEEMDLVWSRKRAGTGSRKRVSIAIAIFLYFYLQHYQHAFFFFFFPKYLKAIKAYSEDWFDENQVPPCANLLIWAYVNRNIEQDVNHQSSSKGRAVNASHYPFQTDFRPTHLLLGNGTSLLNARADPQIRYQKNVISFSF